MIVNYYLKLMFQNFSTLFLAILIALIVANWLIELTNYQPRANGSSSLRSHFFITLLNCLDKYKIEIIILTLTFLLILNINSLDNAIIKLLSLAFVLSGSIEILKTIRKEKQTRQKVEALDKRKTEFLADIAHKIKTPLTIARMNIELTKKELEDDDLKEAKESTMHSVQSVDKLNRLCTNLITIGKIDFGISMLNKKEINLSQLVENTASDFKVLLGDRKLKIDIYPDIKIFGDSDRLQEMILNLLDNAVKFTDPDTGKISVSLSVTPADSKKDSRFKSNSDGGNDIVLTICDNGIGIAKDHLPKLFDRYYQAESRSGSAGIGLAICKWIVEGHNGKIEIKSERKKGTKVVVIL